jgi:molybdenum cofactor cytidylyltransferase
MGEQKLLMPFRGSAMVDWVLKTVLECGFDGISAVVSAETLSRLSQVGGVDYLVNPDPDRGQDSSFRHALAALGGAVSFAVFLADKPAITARQVMELRRNFEAVAGCAKKSALVPMKDGAPGHPAFYSPLWRERFLEPEESARAALFRHKDEVEWANAPESCFLDVDTPEDYRRMLKYGGSK